MLIFSQIYLIIIFFFITILPIIFNRPTYDDIANEIDSLVQTYPDYATAFYYGQSVEGRTLTGIKIQKKKLNNIKNVSNKAIHITGVTHGNEYMNIVDRLPKFFLGNKDNTTSIKSYLDQGGVLYITPIFNPDGFTLINRLNGNEADLNRDFPNNYFRVKGLRQPETQAYTNFIVKDLEDNNLNLMLAIDYHCCAHGAYMPVMIPNNSVGARYRELYQQVGQIILDSMQRNFVFGDAYDLNLSTNRGTSKDYYFEKFGALGLTFEGTGPEGKYFDKHTQMWQKLINFVNTGNATIPLNGLINHIPILVMLIGFIIYYF